MQPTRLLVSLLFILVSSFRPATLFAQPTGYMAVQNGATVSIYNPATGKESGYWPAPGIVSGLIFSPDGSAVYAIAYLPDGIWQLNSATHTVIRKFPAESPSLLAINSTGRTLFAATKQGIVAFDTATGATTAQATLPSGYTATSLTVSPDSKTLYVVTAPPCAEPPYCGSKVFISAYDAVSLHLLHTFDVTDYNPQAKPLVILNDNVNAFLPVELADIHTVEIAVLNLETGALETQIPFPAESLQLSPDNQTLYASDGSAIAAISTSTQTITQQIQLPAGAISNSALSANGSTLYITTCLTSCSINPVATDGLVLGTPIPAPSHPVILTVSPTNDALWAANSFANEILAFSPVTNRSMFVAETSASASGVTVSADGQSLFVINRSTVDIKHKGTLTLTATIPLPPVEGTLNPPVAVASPDGQRLFVINQQKLYAIDLKTNQIIKNLGFARGIVVSPDSSKLYVSATGTSSLTLTVYDTGSLVQVNAAKLRNVFADSPFLSPDGKTLFLIGSDIYKLDAATLTVTRTASNVFLGESLITSDGTTIFGVTTNSLTSSFSVLAVDTATLSITRTYPVAATSGFEYFLALTPNNTGLYVSNSPYTVAPIPLKELNLQTGAVTPVVTQLYGPLAISAK